MRKLNPEQAMEGATIPFIDTRRFGSDYNTPQRFRAGLESRDDDLDIDNP